MSADPEMRQSYVPSQASLSAPPYAHGVDPRPAANFSFAEEEPAPVNSLHGVISTPLPCPFCGGEAQIEVTRVILSDRSWVYCQCGASTAPSYNREEAIARWNRRAPRPLTSMEEFIVGFADYVQAELKKRGIG